MIISLHIDQTDPGIYSARILDGRNEIAEFQAVTISAAIRQGAVGVRAGVEALHLWYEHVSIGTTSVYAMAYDAETLAKRLVSLHSQFKR
ncbi:MULTISPECIES: hypothetical protein [Comamonas]|uniref:Uncharacterized protein n=1 Tax=Comamonas terrae TaxID=673548 RepID=A0ABW5URU0_9BURK|nr:hypothetical protein [Comamonas terrae]